MPTRIILDQLVKRFDAPKGKRAAGRTDRVNAVDGVSLTIEPGELFFLLGPSGCGKTTLLRMIAGFIEPTAGRILFGEEGGTPRDVTVLAASKRNTGMVFQSYALWPHMTVAENVAFGLQVRKVAEPERSRRIAEALAAVQMEAFAERKPTQLSGGQQQRVALARALVVRPEVLLLDEPLSNLDAKLRVDLRRQIRQTCKAAGITSVYVTHDQKEALSMADRVAVMNQGRVAQVGTPGELYRRPGSRFVAEFLGETNFLGGTIVAREGSTVTVRTPAGDFRSSCAEGIGANAAVTLSIRPEAFRVVSPSAEHAAQHTTTLPARVVESTYLGETAQLVAELAGGVRVKVAHLNPASSTPDAVTLGIAPDDVVVVPG